MKWTLLVLILHFISSNAFEFKCPSKSHWALRSKGYCKQNEKVYSCLLNTLRSIYEENCGSIEITRIGHKYILAPNPDERECSTDRYQPFMFLSNVSSECAYSKSLCNEEGQVLANNGSTVDDVSCMCDYTRNYDYVSRTKKSNCNPTKEDCSCYHKVCGYGQSLSTDYYCIDPQSSVVTTKCPDCTSTDDKGIVKVPDKPSSSDSSSTEASVYIIIMIVLFIVMYLLLFIDLRPQVIQKPASFKKDSIIHKCDKSFTYTVIPGSSVPFQCEVTSRFGIRSIIWQKEWNGEITDINHSTDKYTLNNSELEPSLTINNVTTKDMGTYKCIVRNSFGLSNIPLDRCFIYIRNISASLFRTIQFFPACSREEIHWFTLNVCSLPKIYVKVLVSRGKYLALKVDTDQNTESVLWFKFSKSLSKEQDGESEDTITSGIFAPIWFRKTEDKYSGGSITDPNLTIHTAGLQDAGRYVCTVVSKDGKAVSYGRKLLVIPQEKTYKEVSLHWEDKTYISLSTADKAKKILENHGMVILTGREGTGKTKMCLELATMCEKDDFLPYKVDITRRVEDLYDLECLLIVDNDPNDKMDTDQLLQLLHSFFGQQSRRIIITCNKVQINTLKSCLQNKKLFKEDMIIDIDRCITKEEKEKILKVYMELHGIQETPSIESNFRDKEVINDKKIQVKLDTYSVKQIIDTDPFQGFPLTVAWFCADRKKLHLGEKYFTNPPKSLVEGMKTLYESAKNSASLELKYKYCVLVYITVHKDHQIDIHKVDNKQMTYLQKTLFNMVVKTSSNMIPDINKAAESLTGTYLICERDVYCFIHPYILKAVFLSSEFFLYYLIQKGSLNDVMEFIRGFKYHVDEEELVLKVPAERTSDIYYLLCEILVHEACHCENTTNTRSKDIYKYVYSCFIKPRDLVFWKRLCGHLIAISYHKCNTQSSEDKQMKKKLSSRLSFKKDKESSLSLQTCEETTDSEPFISSMQVIDMLDNLTNYGRDPWIYYCPDLPNLIILYGLIVAAKSRYMEDVGKNATFNEILKIFHHRLENKDILGDLGTPLDEYGNTIFHYLTLFREEEACCVFKQCSYMLPKENNKMLKEPNLLASSPMDIAVYLGKFKLLKLFFEMMKESKNKRLLKLAKDGMKSFYGKKSSETKLAKDGMESFYGKKSSETKLAKDGMELSETKLAKDGMESSEIKLAKHGMESSETKLAKDGMEPLYGKKSSEIKFKMESNFDNALVSSAVIAKKECYTQFLQI